MFLVVILMLLIALFQVPIIVNKKRWRELIAFALLWSIALAYALLVASPAVFPNPTDVLVMIIERISP